MSDRFIILRSESGLKSVNFIYSAVVRSLTGKMLCKIIPKDARGLLRSLIKFRRTFDDQHDGNHFFSGSERRALPPGEDVVVEVKLRS